MLLHNMKRFDNHVHTEFSNAGLGFSDSTNKLTDLIQRAYDIGLVGISITDHDCITGHIQALKYFESMKKDRDFKIALGNEIYLMSEQEFNDNVDGVKFTPYYHFVLTALDTEGHHQLRMLSTRSWGRSRVVNGIMRKPTYYSDIEEIVKKSKGHIIASTACLGGRLGRLILDWKLNGNIQSKIDIHNFITWCIDVFGKDNFFLEAQPCFEDNIEQRTVNQTLKVLSTAYNIPLISTTDAHYLTKEDRFVHKTLLKSQDGDREVDSFYATTYLMDCEEMYNFLSIDFSAREICDLYNNSLSIQKRIKGYNLKHQPIIPARPIEDIPNFTIQHLFKEWYDTHPAFKYYATEATNTYDRYFFYRIEKALKEKVVNNHWDIDTYIDRCELEMNELKIISQEFNDSMANYYVSVSKIVEIIWESGSLAMPGRGSAGAYVISFLLDITQITPIPFGESMPFWRHLNHQRGIEIPDIDLDSEGSKREIILENLKKYFGYDKVLTVLTCSTLKPKVAVERSCKGLGLGDEIAGYLKSLIPVERGSLWSISDCIYGNTKENRKPIPEFINELNKHEHLKECLLGLENLVVNRGLHAGGVLITNTPYTDTVGAMRSPNGVLCTCYDLHDTEYCGGVKVDMLTVQSADKIHQTLDLLLEYGKIEWQGDLKSTYDKYLHPTNLEYDNKEMWEILPQIYSVFQFDTDISKKALSAVKPQSLEELSATNSLLRLQVSGEEQPLDTFIRYKTDINEWKKDCEKWGLNQEEMNIIKSYLEQSYMLADSQEKIMRISMDEKVANFTLKESNKLRKSIAKKDPKVREEIKSLFYEQGLKIGTRKIFLDYIWNEVFGKSFGYSFSSIHSLSYSIIALQELNLNFFYPSIYWNCACLNVESTTDDDKKSKTTDYGTLTKALYKMKHHNVNILPPNINTSSYAFTPNEKDNTIEYGLGGINKINKQIADEIIANRPYNSFQDFYNKMCKNKNSLIKPMILVNLIKSGCFDKLPVGTEMYSNISNKRIRLAMIHTCLLTPSKNALTVSNINQCLEWGIEELPNNCLQFYQLKLQIINKNNFFCNDKNFKSKKHYKVPNFLHLFVEENILPLMTEDKDYYYNEDDLILIDKSLEKALKPYFEELKTVLNSAEVLAKYNKTMLNQNFYHRYKTLSPIKWGFETTSFYHEDKHELSGINYEKERISKFMDLPLAPKFITKKYELSRICGTIVSKNDNKHIITILTPDFATVGVKFQAEQYAYYKKDIVDIINGEPKVIDSNWLARGNMIVVTGYRTGEDSFRVKRYANSIYQHTILKIESIDGSTGELTTSCVRADKLQELS